MLITFPTSPIAVRGGGDMGRLWYEDGKFLKKTNTFTDFIAAAEHLVKVRSLAHMACTISLCWCGCVQLCLRALTHGAWHATTQGPTHLAPALSLTLFCHPSPPRPATPALTA